MRIVVIIKTGDGALWAVPQMVALRDRGHRVSAVLPATDGELGRRLRASGIEMVTNVALDATQGRVRRLLALAGLRRHLTAVAPDVVLSHLYLSAVIARLVTIGMRSRLIYMSPGPLYLENPVIRFAERLLVRLDDHVVCSSEHLLQRYVALGVPRSRLSQTSYGADLEWYVPASPDERLEARRHLGLPSTGFVAVCVAVFYGPKRLVHRGRGVKGHDVLLDAWAAFLGQGGDGTLLLVGSGFGPGGEQLRDDLRRHAEALGLGDSVRWIDQVADVRPFYRAADVSIAPSLSDNLGSTAESSGMGVPAVVSTVGGLAELVVDDVTGWTVPPDDVPALAAVLGHVHRLHRRSGLDEYGARARRLAEVIVDRRACVERYVEVVEDVGGRPRPQRSLACG